MSLWPRIFRSRSLVLASHTSVSLSRRAGFPALLMPMARARSSGFLTVSSPVLKPSNEPATWRRPPFATGASAFMPTAVMVGNSAKRGLSVTTAPPPPRSSTRSRAISNRNASMTKSATLSSSLCVSGWTTSSKRVRCWSDAGGKNPCSLQRAEKSRVSWSHQRRCVDLKRVATSRKAP